MLKTLGVIIFLGTIIGLLVANTILLVSKPNEIIVYKERVVFSTKHKVFLHCLEKRRPISDMYDTKNAMASNNNDIEDCKKAAMELVE